MRSLQILSLGMVGLSTILAGGGAFLYKDDERISERLAISMVILVTPFFLPLFAMCFVVMKEGVKSLRWKFKRKIEWQEGDIFCLPFASRRCVGKIIKKVRNTNGNTATVAFYDCRIFPVSKNDTIALREDNRISTIEFSAHDLDFGNWSILKKDNVVLPSCGETKTGDEKKEQIHAMKREQIPQFIEWFFHSSDSEKIKNEYFTFLSYQRQERILKL